MFKKVLIAIDIDDTTSARSLVETSMRYMETGAELHFLYVVPDLTSAVSQASHFEVFTNESREDWVKHLIERASDHLKDFADEYIPVEANAKLHVLSGSAYEEIIEAVQKYNIDLIIMGAHRPELRDYLLGPNAARVVRHAPASVLVVRA